MSLFENLFNVPTADDAEKTAVIGRDFFAAAESIFRGHGGTFDSAPGRGFAKLMISPKTPFTADEKRSLLALADRISQRHGYRIEIVF